MAADRHRVGRQPGARGLVGVERHLQRHLARLVQLGEVLVEALRPVDVAVLGEVVGDLVRALLVDDELLGLVGQNQFETAFAEAFAVLKLCAARANRELGVLKPEVADAIERAAIRDKLSPCEILLVVETNFSQYSRQQLVAWIERFFRLWSRNQWKRERYAPSFHLDDENLDPKTWCRFPILSGGYERELAELRKMV